MNKRTFFIGIILSSILSGLISCVVVYLYLSSQPANSYNSISNRQLSLTKNRPMDTAYVVPEGLNFVNAAQKVIPGVVHIRSLYSSGKYSINPLEGYFRSPTQSSGSGVIVSDDGFIVTNNHVVENASNIEVVLNDNRTYLAKTIGTDPTTDLALLKIEEQNLTFVEYGNSDFIKTGEWVLAIGNPFDLTSTVTAGIVSAKARNIGILRDKNNLQIEAFIQTDAAVNPGNSGGALVNLKGKLVGINTAIATPTGNYAGYSFAVPVSLVKKVIDDLLEFGEVQRALLGIRIGDMNSRIAAAEGLNIFSGVFVSDVYENSAADKAGIMAGDIIIAINKMPIHNVSELQEMIARNRPGDEVDVTFIREGSKQTTEATLQNTEGTVDILMTDVNNVLEGATLENFKASDDQESAVEKGVLIKELNDGKWKDAGLEPGFIITKVDKIEVNSIDELYRSLKNKSGGILIEGIKPDGSEGLYGIDW